MENAQKECREDVIPEFLYKLSLKGVKMDKIKNQLKEAGFDFAVAVATKAEIDAQAACGQLGLID